MKVHFLMVAALTVLGITAQAQTANMEYEELIPEAQKATATQKNVVKLYSKKETGVLVVTSHRPMKVQICIFDLDGTLIFSTQLRRNQKKKVEGIAKGTYNYSIFNGEESVEEGQLVIK